ncbi:hypothetical protein PRIPAC_80001 [Pristionchus pacificus]|uniref:ARF7EP_C domain-containing protein n=1 Tax=Pristionchus pacificus TaxID=54126 RepID=A0A2A6BY43_PRIPA|nr:hypothetical protein PRIPAC_80001 [Pristionchus pacificus]|eukprot:PDM70830.1 hypothetical protein PRIPAC_45034 [Pristionchus pacificus]
MSMPAFFLYLVLFFSALIMRVRKVKAKKEAAEKEAHPEVDIASDDASISKITTPPGSKKMQQMVCEIEAMGVEGLEDVEKLFVVFICLFSEAKVQRVTRSLLFANPGVNAKEPAYYIDLHREKRAAANIANAKIVRNPQTSSYAHNEKGEFIVRTMINDKEVEIGKIPLCDCCKVECKGCFWPCAKCGGRRCSTECQVLRPYAIASTSCGGGGLNDKTKIINPLMLTEEEKKAKKTSKKK